ncbi:MAG: hypothetical protein DSO04_04110 [Hadesarchaea archaeon]|nr:MAG: hypothetical protein DSO04_04110 [Hadesarchaea archaeon]
MKTLLGPSFTSCQMHPMYTHSGSGRILTSSHLLTSLSSVLSLLIRQTSVVCSRTNVPLILLDGHQKSTQPPSGRLSRTLW